MPSAARRTLSERFFDQWSQFASIPRSRVIMTGWAFAEAIAWPVIPDALLVPLVAGQPRPWTAHLTACIAGSAAGATLLFALASAYPDETLSMLRHVPLVFDADIRTVEQKIEDQGVWGLLTQPVSGIPFKVWGAVSAGLGVPLWPALAIALAARAARMTIVAGVTALTARWAGERLRRHSIAIALGYAAIFIIGWIWTLPLGR